MKRILLATAALATLAFSPSVFAADLKPAVEADYDYVLDLYK